MYTQPTHMSSAKYALDISTTILEAFEEWTGMPDPIGKLGKVGTPGADPWERGGPGGQDPPPPPPRPPLLEDPQTS